MSDKDENKNKNQNDNIIEFMKKIKNFAMKIGMIRDSWVNDKNGEFTVVSKDEIERLQAELDGVQDILNGLQGEIEETKKETLTQVEQKISKLKGIIKEGNPEIVSIIAEIFEKGTTEIEELGTLTVGEFKPTGEIENENSEKEEGTKKRRGGDIATISTKGFEHQPESNNKKDREGEKTIGGAIISGKNKEFGEELEGEYVKKEDILEVINGVITSVLAEVENIKQKGKNETLDVSKTIETHFDEISKNVKQTSKNIPQPKLKGTAVKAKTIFTKRAIAVMLSAMMALGTVVGLGLSKNEDYAIPLDSESITVNIDETEEIIDEVFEDIEEKYDNNKEYISETGESGENPNATPVQTSRPEYLQEHEELRQYREEYERLKEEFENLQNPTNSDYIEYNIKILELQQELLDFSEEVKDGDKEALENWIEANNYHISSGNMTKEKEEEHKAENENNEYSIETREKEIKELNAKRAGNKEKIEFYSKLLQLEEIEDISNIEDFSETLYNFCQDNGIDANKLVDRANDENMKLDLLVSYIKVVSTEKEQSEATNGKQENIDLDKIIAEYSLLENTYNEYVDSYGEEPDYSTYVNYYKTAKEEFMENLGQDEKFFGEFFGKLEQNNMNRRYYEQTHEKDIGTMEQIKEFFGTVFDRARSKEYNEAIKKLEQYRDIQQGKGESQKGDTDNQR